MISSSGVTTVRVGAPAEAIGAVLRDPAAIGRVIPGCESVEATGAGTFRLVLTTHVGFLTVTADVDAVLREVDPPRRLVLELDGRTRGFDGGFTASIPFELVPEGDGATTVSYEVGVRTRGTVALAGDAAVARAIHALADDLVGGLEREAASPRS